MMLASLLFPLPLFCVRVCGVRRGPFSTVASPPIRGHQKNRRKGGPKNRDWVGVKKYGFREGDNFMRQGGGREEELWKKWQKKINLGQKVAIFKTLQESGKCWKTAISRCQGGDRMKIFLKSSILLGGPKMALGRTTYYGGNQPMDIPPPPPPLPTYAPPFPPPLPSSAGGGSSLD